MSHGCGLDGGGLVGSHSNVLPSFNSIQRLSAVFFNRPLCTILSLGGNSNADKSRHVVKHARPALLRHDRSGLSLNLS